MSYGKEIQSEFAKTYARIGNATHALKQVLGEERADKMKPHTLRAKACELLRKRKCYHDGKDCPVTESPQ